MKYLVVGGCGFIGSHLTETLLNQGHWVTVVDNLSGGDSRARHQEMRWGKLWKDGDDDRLILHTMNVELFNGLEDHGHFGQFDGVFDLASPVGPAGILPYAGRIIREIVSSTYAAISLAQRRGCRLVFVSTSEVYNGGEQGLCSETTPCIVTPERRTVRMEYGVGKLAAEFAVLNTPGLDSVIIRPFNVAGPGQSEVGGFVLPRWAKQLLRGEPLTVFGDGSAVRAFTHVADIVDGLIAAMRLAQPQSIYNLGNPANRTTIKDLAYKMLFEGELITRTLNPGLVYVDGKSVYGPSYAEASDKYPVATRAMDELGWHPSRDISAILLDVLAYEKGRLHEATSVSR